MIGNEQRQAYVWLDYEEIVLRSEAYRLNRDAEFQAHLMMLYLSVMISYDVLSSESWWLILILPSFWGKYIDGSYMRTMMISFGSLDKMAISLVEILT